MSDLRQQIQSIASDFHPDRDTDATLALSEMRYALLAALEETKVTARAQMLEAVRGVYLGDKTTSLGDGILSRDEIHRIWSFIESFRPKGTWQFTMDDDGTVRPLLWAGPGDAPNDKTPPIPTSPRAK